MYYIYKHTAPNGKVYIGQTHYKNLNRRWQNGLGYKAQTEFFTDILAFGWNNIQHEVLEQVETKEEATVLERKYILEHRSNEPEYGYNKNTNLSSDYDADMDYKREWYKQYRLKNGYEFRPIKKVRCIETGQIYDNMTAAGQAVGRTKEAIRKAIATQGKCAGCHWEKIET